MPKLEFVPFGATRAEASPVPRRYLRLSVASDTWATRVTRDTAVQNTRDAATPDRPANPLLDACPAEVRSAA